MNITSSFDISKETEVDGYLDSFVLAIPSASEFIYLCLLALFACDLDLILMLCEPYSTIYN